MSWHAPKDLAKLRSRDLPKSVKGIRERAQREGWESRRVRGRGGRDGMRTEYQPPADVQQQIDEIEARHARGEEIFDGEADAQRGLQRIRSQTVDGEHLRAGYVHVPLYGVRASAGNGALVGHEQIVDYLAFRADWVRNVLRVSHKDLVLINVTGDSMEPTLSSDDLILVDTSADRIGDSAIYVLKNLDRLLVKRLQHKLDGTVVVKCDNARYDSETYTAEAASALAVVGRVVWAGRKL